MRKIAAFVLAVPVIAALYVPVAFRRSVAARIGLTLGAGTLFGLAAITVTPPQPTAARPPTPPSAVGAVRFSAPIAANQPLDGAVAIDFSTPMDPTSVAGAVSVAPFNDVTLRWEPGERSLLVVPIASWRPGTYYTVTVGAGVRARDGTVTSDPIRAVFLTRARAAGSLRATRPSGQRMLTTSGFRLVFDRPIDTDSVRRALTIEPTVDGTLEVNDEGAFGHELLFQPSQVLAPGTIYTVSFSGAVMDADGAEITVVKPLRVRTVAPPAVVRFRPLNGVSRVTRSTLLSVRFTRRMTRNATAAAFSVLVNGRRVAGRVSWAEGDTVLVFDPAALLPYSSKVTLAVSNAARSADGVELGAARRVTFTIEPQPKPTPRTPTRPPTRPPASTSSGSTGGSSGGSSGSSGGGSVGAGAWAGVETYYLRLMNCTRTGGLITSSGACSSPGGRNVAPLRLDAGISTRVARPYARLLATRGQCSHFIGGSPGNRLHRAGYPSNTWAENLGCRSGNPYNAVLGSHLFFQSERSYRGGHYVNLMNAAYDRVGIGVWVSGGRVRLVVDFYHP